MIATCALFSPSAQSALDLPLVGRAGEALPEPMERPSVELPEAGETVRPMQHDIPDAQFITRARAADLARKQYGGRILDVRWTGTDYRVKLLRSGSVRIVTIADIPDNKAQ
ncbi:hypothetical protein [Algiphilus sp.]|uniref:hypothetical protein n=1 Tax=Algiphilus sp. TaxID=1872431 RepID=UPI003B51A282